MGDSLSCTCAPHVAPDMCGAQLDCSEARKHMPKMCTLMDPTEITWDESVIVNLKLLRASGDGNLEEIGEAIRAGADLETRRTPHVRPQEPLIDDYGDPTCGDKDLAAMGLYPDMQASTASTFARTKSRPHPEGLTALMRAAQQGRPEAVSLLLTARASLTARDEDGMQPLHFAAEAACLDSCKALLSGRANPAEKDDNDRDAFGCLPRETMLTRAERARWESILKQANHSETVESLPAEVDPVGQTVGPV
mmetsp:Transcript_80601/g.178988  ORF Transcript_80601/g.178988 Transcript_80601/m.178988 type:complete len:251 (-) Transcript_80601:44-796(-)